MIIDHPTQRFDGDYGQEPCKVVQCDFCTNTAPTGTDMHSAVDKAHTAKYTTVRGRTAVSPRKWSCPACTNKRSQQQ